MGWAPLVGRPADYFPSGTVGQWLPAPCNGGPNKRAATLEPTKRLRGRLGPRAGIPKRKRPNCHKKRYSRTSVGIAHKGGGPEDPKCVKGRDRRAATAGATTGGRSGLLARLMDNAICRASAYSSTAGPFEAGSACLSPSLPGTNGFCDVCTANSISGRTDSRCSPQALLSAVADVFHLHQHHFGPQEEVEEQYVRWKHRTLRQRDRLCWLWMFLPVARFKAKKRGFRDFLVSRIRRDFRCAGVTRQVENPRWSFSNPCAGFPPHWVSTLSAHPMSRFFSAPAQERTLTTSSLRRSFRLCRCHSVIILVACPQ